ncbi:MAG: DUF547 domain-containing protein [Candidatus Omnitrophica bacterium]|nr:hypothetical protein [bacterium]NUN95995.1 DUF547 domain-containing protein [Candidatus Omnitrophota bacterium]
MKRILTGAMLLLLSCFTIQQGRASEAPHDHFSAILARVVDADTGWVDYTTLRKLDGELEEYLAELRGIHPKTLPTKGAQLAYFLNLYNALVLKGVLDHWPVKSVLHDFKDNAFFEQFTHETALGKITLNHLEHEVIRKRFKDPRVHFALNCASKGCPPLHRAAFTADGLNTQLDSVCSAFVNDPHRTHLDFKKGRASISALFQWYAEDFEESGGALGFIARYHKGGDKGHIRELTVEHQDYDWSLNSLGD